MHVDEEMEGPFRIYAAALEAQQGGYRPAVALVRLLDVPQPIEVFRDERLTGDHTWDDPAHALALS
jgi:hypothetical protein